MWQKLMFITCSRLAHQRSHNRGKPFLKLQLIFHASAILYLWRDSFWLQTLALVVREIALSLSGKSLSPFLVFFAILAVSFMFKLCRTATDNFWQQWQPHQLHAAATLYSSKFRQGLARPWGALPFLMALLCRGI